MRIARLALAASLTLAAPAYAQPVQLPEGMVKFSEFVTKIFLQTAVSAARSQVEMTYDDIVLDLAAGRMAMTGLDIRPELPWDPSGDCTARPTEGMCSGMGCTYFRSITCMPPRSHGLF